MLTDEMITSRKNSPGTAERDKNRPKQGSIVPHGLDGSCEASIREAFHADECRWDIDEIFRRPSSGTVFDTFAICWRWPYQSWGL